jgi:hypothetical protein
MPVPRENDRWPGQRAKEEMDWEEHGTVLVFDFQDTVPRRSQTPEPM